MLFITIFSAENMILHGHVILVRRRPSANDLKASPIGNHEIRSAGIVHSLSLQSFQAALQRKRNERRRCRLTAFPIIKNVPSLRMKHQFGNISNAAQGVRVLLRSRRSETNSIGREMCNLILLLIVEQFNYIFCQ